MMEIIYIVSQHVVAVKNCNSTSSLLHKVAMDGNIDGNRCGKAVLLLLLNGM